MNTWFQALGPHRSHPALGDRVGPRRSERRASLGNTETTHPPIEAGAIALVAVMNEKTWRLVIPTAAFDNLLCRPLGGRMRRHMHVGGGELVPAATAAGTATTAVAASPQRQRSTFLDPGQPSMASRSRPSAP